ncbi:helicase associated domain-containing protein [Streptomyces chartreusis]
MSGLVTVPCADAWRIWDQNMAAARQFHARDGHLRVPRQHHEEVDGETVGLGSFVANAQRRAAKLSLERRGDLEQLGMRWKLIMTRAYAE